jgi:alpha-L-fucosidase
MKILTVALVVSLSVASNVFAEEAKPTQHPWPKPDPAAMKQWQGMRFGMFIHWGPVSLTGHEIGWSRGRETAIEQYDNLYKKFNPEKFDADQWLQIAKEAGMKYMIITSKHHDGFCIWPSKVTDYDIGETPFKRDVLGELSEACKKQDIRFGTYYSVCDWHHPDFPRGSPGGRTEKPNADIKAYDKYLRAQTKELIENYGPLVAMWFDVPQVYGYELGDDMVKTVRALQPDILINNRAYRRAAGDFVTPEQKIGGFNRDQPWETCMTICRQWAWKPNDNMKSLKQCLQTLISTAGGDGNLLFNVGPMPDGRIEPRQAERLKEMGQWLSKYGKTIYGTRGGPFKPGDWGASTCKEDTIYLFVMKWTGDNTLTLPNQGITIQSAKALTGGRVELSQLDKGISIQVAKADQDDIATVIEVKVEGNAFDIAPMDVTSPIGKQ